jgi:hypothetical protein
MASESLTRGKTGRFVWEPNGTARTESWDCEVLQRAAAEMFNVATAVPMGQQQQASKSNETGAKANPLTYRGRW